MRLRLDLGALLAGGRLEPREIVLVGGEIRLPWPPGALPSFRPPPWLTALDARLEDCRVLIGGLELEKLNARLVTGGAAEALVTEGSFAWRGQAVRFSGQLGRAGFDGIAPLDLGLAVGGATLSARGVLMPAGGFEGRMDAAGNDLSALVPAPRGAVPREQPLHRRGRPAGGGRSRARPRRAAGAGRGDLAARPGAPARHRARREPARSRRLGRGAAGRLGARRARRGRCR